MSYAVDQWSSPPGLPTEMTNERRTRSTLTAIDPPAYSIAYFSSLS